MTEGNDIPQIAEAKDTIIQMLQEQIKNLQAENKSLRETMVSSLKETQNLQQAQLAELKSLRADTVTVVAEPIIAEALAESKLPENIAGGHTSLLDRFNEQSLEITELKEALNKAEALVQHHEDFISQKFIEHEKLILEHNRMVDQIIDSPYVRDKQKIRDMLACTSNEK